MILPAPCVPCFNPDLSRPKPDSILALALQFESVTTGDFESLLAIRTAAMRPSLEHLGRFDPARSRERLQRLFFPDHTQFILHDQQRVGFFTFRPVDEHLRLEHLYVLPAHQSIGVGSTVLRSLITQADTANRAIELCALIQSASNQFYQRHGFVAQSEDDWNVNYRREPTRPQT